METLSGVVERITYMNEENGFSVIKISSYGHRDLVTVVGNLVGIHIGAVVNFRGDWRNDSKFGRQFAVTDYEETMPATVKGIEKYLGSGLIKGVGPVYAKKIVKKFKEETIEIIDRTPDRLMEVPGIGAKRVAMIKEAWIEQREIKNVMIFLQGHGVSTAFAVKIFKTYGDSSIDIVQSNPYRLADDIWGIGFRTADKIAQSLGFALDSYERCRAGIIYIVNELSGDGHCYATFDQIYKAAAEILEIDEAKVNTTMGNMFMERSIIRDGEDIVYLPAFYYSEVGAAGSFANLIKGKTDFQNDGVDVIIKAIETFENIEYDQVQKDAIKAALASKVMVLTGGPGTGKTTTTLAIIKAFQRLGGEVLLAAPTGRAAKRMAETTKMEAKTIHRLLEYTPNEGYKRNEDNPLECDVLILDEVSMVDLILVYNLLKAIPREAVLILVGDIDQLPSVGAGNVLRDVIDSGVVTVVQLTRIFRQAEGSAIIKNAHRINTGNFPDLSTRTEGDFFFIEEDDPDRLVELIKGLCKTRLPQYYQVDPVADIQVLAPMQRGATGAMNLNTVLQEALNPSLTSIKFRGSEYRLGDKVMQIKNNYDKNVFNGDIGQIKEIDLEDKVVTISYDGESVFYDVSELDEVVLAYATTVHKSQGSEYKIVVAPFTTQHYMMLQRNLLYTCITRAKEIMVLVGTKQAIAIAVRNNKISQRNTKLAERMRMAVADNESESDLFNFLEE